MNTTTKTLRYVPAVALPRTGRKFLSNPESLEIKAACEQLEAQFLAVGDGTVVQLTLEGVTVTGSCIAALLTPSLLRIVRGDYRQRFLVVIDPLGSHAWDADAALKKQSSQSASKLVCVWRAGEKIELVGTVDEQVASTYFFALTHSVGGDGVTSRQLAEAEGITIQAASNRFAKTAVLGLLHKIDRESVTGGGVQHVFVPVT